ATHRDLEDEVAAGRFRQDFFFRVHVFTIELPPLRERPADIPVLAQHFLGRFATAMNRKIGGFSPAALAAMTDYPWPGNVRELQNAIERAVVLCKGDTIEAAHFPFSGPAPAAASFTLASSEEAHIRKVLAAMGFNVAQAARALEIDRVTLYNKMRKYGIDRP
ncbi:MAG: sigma 54-interacting transcriptional regulator, partial [Thermoanaerobaculia bacterium]|nr:sigma 54-interacting transcriptional regulator [Thermoanaerobaculia bacterium]